MTRQECVEQKLTHRKMTSARPRVAKTDVEASDISMTELSLAALNPSLPQATQRWASSSVIVRVLGVGPRPRSRRFHYGHPGGHPNFTHSRTHYTVTPRRCGPCVAVRSQLAEERLRAPGPVDLRRRPRRIEACPM